MIDRMNWLIAVLGTEKEAPARDALIAEIKYEGLGNG